MNNSPPKEEMVTWPRRKRDGPSTKLHNTRTNPHLYEAKHVSDKLASRRIHHDTANGFAVSTKEAWPLQLQLFLNRLGEPCARLPGPVHERKFSKILFLQWAREPKSQKRAKPSAEILPQPTMTILELIAGNKGHLDTVEP